MEKRFLYLVGKKLAGEAGKQELEELSNILADNKELEQLYTGLFAQEVSNTNRDLLNAEQAYATHFVKMQLNNQFGQNTAGNGEKKMQSRKMRNLLLVAALVVIVAGVAWMYKALNTGTAIQESPALAGQYNKNEIVTKKGSKTNVRLPDGTQVWLNSDSKITYAENFQGSTREVQLTGEAFFDVVRDTTRPFIIHTQAINIKVLGTAFNVRSYPDEKNTETSLVRGTIEVTLLNQEDKKIILKPNDRLSVANSDEPLSIDKPGPGDSYMNAPVMTLGKMKYLAQDTTRSAEILWVDNKLAFDNEPLEKVASKIGRWFNKEVVIQDETLKNLRFTAIFENESPDEVMEALQLTNGLFTYRISNGVIIINAIK